jgi:hypothetical protein
LNRASGNGEFFDVQEEADLDIEIEDDEEEEDNMSWRHLIGHEMGDVTFVDTPVDRVLFEGTKKGTYCIINEIVFTETY